jgi:hypothetical protein
MFAFILILLCWPHTTIAAQIQTGLEEDAAAGGKTYKVHQYDVHFTVRLVYVGYVPRTVPQVLTVD